MVMNMSTNYCMVNTQTGVCENVVLWDGNPESWTPPEGYLLLVQNTTPAKVWLQNANTLEWVLSVVEGVGQIGFTWDGTYLVTNEPQPQPLPAAADQPAVAGAQTL
jgi:hypothetical protein